MTDLEILRELLDRSAISYEVCEKISPYYEAALYVEKGYEGFVTIFQFNKSHKLVDMGAWHDNEH